MPAGAEPPLAPSRYVAYTRFCPLALILAAKPSLPVVHVECSEPAVVGKPQLEVPATYTEPVASTASAVALGSFVAPGLGRLNTSKYPRLPSLFSLTTPAPAVVAGAA